MTTARERIRGPRAAGHIARALHKVPGLALALAAAGCACVDDAADRQTRAAPGFDLAARGERELEMNRQWQNRPLADLVATAGQPQQTVNIPGGGTPPGFVVIYGVDQRSGCIDAFAINAGSTREPTVRIYYCR
jgi:hypothetical protein